MSAESHFEIARSEDAVYVRVVGLGNMNNAATFTEFCSEMLVSGYTKFVIDLAECRGVDSTFMGSLLGLKSDVDEEEGDGVLVVNIDSHCKKQMRSVGLDRILKFHDEPAEIPDSLATHRLQHKKADPVDQIKLVMKAHKALIELDKRNESKFGAFLKTLTKELQ